MRLLNFLVNLFKKNKNQVEEEPIRRINKIHIRLSPWGDHVDKNKLLDLIQMYRREATQYYSVVIDADNKGISNYARGQLDAWELFYNIVKNNKIN